MRARDMQLLSKTLFRLYVHLSSLVQTEALFLFLLLYKTILLK